MFPVGQASKAQTDTIELWIDAASGSDLNDGTQAAPLASVVAAAARLPDFFPYARFNLAPGTYVAPTFIQRVLRGQIDIYAPDFTELVAPAAAVAGSSQLQLMTGGGLGVDTYRGRTVEILSGNAIGDRRTISRHTDTTITPAVAFRAAIAVGDQWRIVEPRTVLQFPDAIHPFEVASQSNLDRWSPFSSDGLLWPGINLVNLHLDTRGVNLQHLYSVNVVRFFGCTTDTVSPKFLVLHGLYQSGVDQYDLDGSMMWAQAGPRLVPGTDPVAWCGWGVSVDGNFSTENVAAELYGVVAHTFRANGGNVFLRGAFNIHTGGIIVAGQGATVIDGKTLLPDIRGAVTNPAAHGVVVVGERVFARLETVDINAPAGNGVYCHRTAQVEIRIATSVIGSTTGVKVETGGHVRFVNGFSVVTTGNAIEVGNAPLTGTPGVAPFNANKGFLAENPGDGSIAQRVD